MGDGTAAKGSEERKRPKWWTTASVLGLLLPVPAGIAYTSYAPLTNDVQGVMVVAAILVNLVAFLTVHLLGRVGLHPYKARRFVNVGSVIGFAAIGIGPVALSNVLLDPHPLEEHEVRVLLVPDRTNDPSVRVEDWRPDSSSEYITIPRLPDGVGVGDHVIVTVGPGLFGYWLESVRRAPHAAGEAPQPEAADGR